MKFLSRFDIRSSLAKLIALPAQPRVFGLDFLRALAILAVMLTHAQFILPASLNAAIQKFSSWGGALGVELFFALSGFLIGSILLSLAPKFANARVLPDFWQRRWFRTLPNYFLFLFLSIATYLLLSKKIPDIFAYLTFTQNWLWPHPELFGPAWSLAVEEWFYLTFPLSIFLIYRFSKSFNVAFLVSAAIFIVIPTLVRIQWAGMAGHANWDEYFRKVMFLRLDAIMYGVLAAWVKKTFPQGWVKWRFLLLALGCLILFFSLSLARSQSLDKSFFAKTFFLSLLPLGFSCLLPAFDQWQVSKENFFTRSLRLVALWSYSLYLSNLLVVGIFLTVQKRLPASLPLSILLFILFYVFCMALSSVVYTYFEKPITDLREKFSKASSSSAT